MWVMGTRYWASAGSSQVRLRHEKRRLSPEQKAMECILRAGILKALLDSTRELCTSVPVALRRGRDERGGGLLAALHRDLGERYGRAEADLRVSVP